MAIEMYGPACCFDERASATDGHRDTIVYPATPNATGTIASIPSAAFNIVRSFPCALTGTVWPGWAVALGENMISFRVLRSSGGQRKTIARGMILRAGWM
ncbi:hypothetical protein [Mycobacterium mantenii]|uniref:hypothetical protein n=1 Tax=Mycobacterium mantenii TaxID=560555 RepID=UPI0013F4C235|nr:hypothetical protein [Mycobacterium mantenii]